MLMNSKKVFVFKSTYGKGEHQIITFGVLTTNGLVVCVFGGQKPHIGAVAIGIPRPSLKNNRFISATTSVFTLVGHKDDEIAKPVALNFAKSLKLVTAAIVGLHIEKATQEDIAKLVANSSKASNQLLHKIQKHLTQAHGKV